jgi:hypothetical protein
MGTSNYLEPYMVAFFPFWSVGVGMAQFDLLEKTTDEKIKYQRGIIPIKSVAVIDSAIYHRKNYSQNNGIHLN